MNGLHGGMSAAPLMAAPRVAAGLTSLTRHELTSRFHNTDSQGRPVIAGRKCFSLTKKITSEDPGATG
jgi:hypothetical protein